MTIDKNFILDYFQQYIFGFIFSDVENCIKARANFSVACLLMSYTEHIGALIQGNLGISGKSKSDFNHFLEYMNFQDNNNYYKDFKIKFKDDQGKEKEVGIYEAFRCGLIHEYFPKVKSIIHNNPDRVDHCIDNDSGIGWIEHDGQQTLRFHTNAYYRDFKKAVDKVFRQIFVQNDSGIICKTEQSLKRIFERELILPSK